MGQGRTAWRRLFAGLPLATATTISLLVMGGFADDRRGVALIMGLGVGLAVWVLWPLFARRIGWRGLVLDALLIVFAIAMGGALGGTLLQPGVFTIIGAVSAVLLPFAYPVSAGLHLVAALATLYIARK